MGWQNSVRAKTACAVVLKNSPYRAVNTSSPLLKKNQSFNAVWSESHTKHINALCGQNVELLNVKVVVHIVTAGLHWVISLHKHEPINAV